MSIRVFNYRVVYRGYLIERHGRTLLLVSPAVTVIIGGSSTSVTVIITSDGVADTVGR